MTRERCTDGSSAVTIASSASTRCWARPARPAASSASRARVVRIESAVTAVSVVPVIGPDPGRGVRRHGRGPARRTGRTGSRPVVPSPARAVRRVAVGRAVGGPRHVAPHGDAAAEDLRDHLGTQRCRRPSGRRCGPTAPRPRGRGRRTERRRTWAAATRWRTGSASRSRSWPPRPLRRSVGARRTRRRSGRPQGRARLGVGVGPGSSGCRPGSWMLSTVSPSTNQVRWLPPAASRRARAGRASWSVDRCADRRAVRAARADPEHRPDDGDPGGPRAAGRAEVPRQEGPRGAVSGPGAGHGVLGDQLDRDRVDAGRRQAELLGGGGQGPGQRAAGGERGGGAHECARDDVAGGPFRARVARAASSLRLPTGVAREPELDGEVR